MGEETTVVRIVTLRGPSAWLARLFAIAALVALGILVVLIAIPIVLIALAIAAIVVVAILIQVGLAKLRGPNGPLDGRRNVRVVVRGPGEP